MTTEGVIPWSEAPQEMADWWLDPQNGETFKGLPIARIVAARPNPGSPVHQIVTIMCPHCGKSHTHGILPGSFTDGYTYGTRVPHCGAHTHELTKTGRRRSPHGRGVKVCSSSQHTDYWIVPADWQAPDTEAPAPPTQER